MSLKTYINGTWKQIVQYIPKASDALPQAPSTASAGTSDEYARADHSHPVQTSVSGNAGTATKLANARTINGVSFDGSANITIPMGDSGSVSLKGSRSTTGSWTITGLTPNKPAYYIGGAAKLGSGERSEITSALSVSKGFNGRSWTDGSPFGYIGSILIPSGSSITISITGTPAYVFQ